MKKLQEIKKSPNADVILLLKQALESAEKGETVGIAMFFSMSSGNEVRHTAAGRISFSEILLAFESWKFDQLLQQHVEQSE